MAAARWTKVAPPERGCETYRARSLTGPSAAGGGGARRARHGAGICAAISVGSGQ